MPIAHSTYAAATAAAAAAAASPIYFGRPIFEVFDALNQLLRRLTLESKRSIVGLFDGEASDAQHFGRIIILFVRRLEGKFGGCERQGHARERANSPA